MPETRRQIRMHRRLSLRLLIAGGAGLIIGATLGALAGAVIFKAGTGAFWTASLSGCIFGFGVGMLAGGYSSLESPDPGNEPSDTKRPSLDRPEATREEHPATDALELPAPDDLEAPLDGDE